MQVVRRHPIHPSTMAMNRAYWTLPGIKGTVWEHYMLVDSQWPTVTRPVDPQNDGAYFPGLTLPPNTPRENYQADGRAQGKPGQHDDRDVLPGPAVELHVLPPEPFQRARARLRRHSGQFSLKPSPRPLSERARRASRRG